MHSISVFLFTNLALCPLPPPLPRPPFPRHLPLHPPHSSVIWEALSSLFFVFNFSYHLQDISHICCDWFNTHPSSDFGEGYHLPLLLWENLPSLQFVIFAIIRVLKQRGETVSRSCGSPTLPPTHCLPTWVRSKEEAGQAWAEDHVMWPFWEWDTYRYLLIYFPGINVFGFAKMWITRFKIAPNMLGTIKD